MKQYEMFDLPFQGSEPQEHWADIPLYAYVTCEEKTICTKGFYAGNGEYILDIWADIVMHALKWNCRRVVLIK